MRVSERSPVLVLLLSAILGAACSGAAETASEAIDAMSAALPSNAPWARVLTEFHRSGGLDYSGLQSKPEDLESYLASLVDARPGDVPREQRIAFWCNVYNAVTAKFVLDGYPEIESVKAVRGFFDTKTFPVAGKDLTLDEIESRARAEGDPRVHFAVVCASTSCPDLRFEPYRGADLDRQLEEQTQAFLADSAKGLRLQGDTLWVSSIFKWYAGDFTGGSTVVAFFARGRVLDWVLSHLHEDLAQQVRDADPSLKYLKYNWSLNDR